MTRARDLFLLTAVSIFLCACTALPQDQNDLPQEISPPTAAAPSASANAAKSTPIQTALVTITSVKAQPSATSTATVLPTEQSPSATLAPTETMTPLAVVPPTLTSVVTTTAELVPSATTVAGDISSAVNAIPVSEIALLTPAAREHVRRLFLAGQQFGRDPHAFSKLGDSVTLTDHFLTRFDSGYYNLGPYEYLQTTIDFYAGSFARYGVATRVGLHAWSIFDPLWANKEWCLPNEHMVACEIRLHNPSVLLIKIGSNDSGPASVFEENLRLLLDYSIENGVIPILATKADRFEGPDDRNNHIIRQLAQEYAIPLWDYDLVAGTLPRRGLSGDDVHMTMADADDYTNPETFERGYPVSDLTALMTLYEVQREVTAAGDA